MFKEMNPQQASVFLIRLSKHIALYFDHPNIKDDDIVGCSIDGWLAKQPGVPGNLIEDPVVAAFLNYIKWNDETMKTLKSTMKSVANRSIGTTWKLHSSVKDLEAHLINSMMTNDTTNFSKFISSICTRDLTHIYDSACKAHKFINSEYSQSLYSVTLLVNYTRKSTVHGALASSNYPLDDVVLTFPKAGLISIVGTAIEYALERFSCIHNASFNTARSNTVIFLKAVINCNGNELISIPLSPEGCPRGANLNKYDIDFRKELNSKWRSAYEIDLGKLEVVGGTTKQLLALAQCMPRDVAHKLKGAAISDDLGV